MDNKIVEDRTLGYTMLFIPFPELDEYREQLLSGMNQWVLEEVSRNSEYDIWKRMVDGSEHAVAKLMANSDRRLVEMSQEYRLISRRLENGLFPIPGYAYSFVPGREKIGPMSLTCINATLHRICSSMAVSRLWEDACRSAMDAYRSGKLETGSEPGKDDGLKAEKPSPVKQVKVNLICSYEKTFLVCEGLNFSYHFRGLPIWAQLCQAISLLYSEQTECHRANEEYSAIMQNLTQKNAILLNPVCVDRTEWKNRVLDLLYEGDLRDALIVLSEMERGRRFRSGISWLVPASLISKGDTVRLNVEKLDVERERFPSKSLLRHIADYGDKFKDEEFQVVGSSSPVTVTLNRYLTGIDIPVWCLIKV